MAGTGAGTYDIVSLLSGDERDYLVQNDGNQVKIEDLKGKTLGLYFSASWCSPCCTFTPELTETYSDLLSQFKPFEVIFVSRDEDGESFSSYFSKMPWLAVPFSDSTALRRLDRTFKVKGIPTLIMIDPNGNVLPDDGYDLIREHGLDAYPFTTERLAELGEILQAQKRNQTLRSLLVSGERDYVVSGQGDKVPVSELEGKYVGLYFDESYNGTCEEFSQILSQMQEMLNQNGESFEIVTVILDTDESSFNDTVAKLPFLSIPFKDKRIKKLERYFKDTSQPGLVIIGPDGKTLCTNCIDAIEEHGVEALVGFPFTPEKMAILEEKTRAKLEQQTLQSLLVYKEFDYVIGKDGTKIPISDLVGKTIILYFCGEWCTTYVELLPRMIEDYSKMKSKHSDAFEIISVSCDNDQDSYDKLYSSMPWPALPFEDPRKSFLKRTFKFRGDNRLVVIGPSGKTVRRDGVSDFLHYGADAYPFTDERIKELKDEIDDKAKGWPQKMKHELHDEHELILTKYEHFYCDGCNEYGHGWSYYCDECDFILHPTCAFKKENRGSVEEEKGHDHEAAKDGYVCEGGVCRKVE